MSSTHTTTRDASSHSTPHSYNLTPLQHCTISTPKQTPKKCEIGEVQYSGAGEFWGPPGGHFRQTCTQTVTRQRVAKKPRSVTAPTALLTTLQSDPPEAGYPTPNGTAKWAAKQAVNRQQTATQQRCRLCRWPVLGCAGKCGLGWYAWASPVGLCAVPARKRSCWATPPFSALALAVY